MFDAQNNKSISGAYILLDKVPIPEPNLFKWAKWMEENRKNKTLHVAEKEVKVGKRTWWISTVFLGLDHSYCSGKVFLFETMIFNHTKGKKCQNYCDFQKRYSTWKEAEEGHQFALDNIKILTATRRQLKKINRIKKS